MRGVELGKPVLNHVDRQPFRFLAFHVFDDNEPLPIFTSDQPERIDRLDVGRDTQLLARLILSKEVAPPATVRVIAPHYSQLLESPRGILNAGAISGITDRASISSFTGLCCCRDLVSSGGLLR